MDLLKSALGVPTPVPSVDFFTVLFQTIYNLLLLLSYPHMMLPNVRIGSILVSNRLIASLTETFQDAASAFLMLKIALRALVTLFFSHHFELTVICYLSICKIFHKGLTR